MYLNIFKLRNNADIIPTIVSVASFLVLAATWIWIDNIALGITISMAVLFAPRAMAAAFVHNHAHSATFDNKWTNIALETILFFITGMMTSKFKLHHNLGHHEHYLDPDKDPSCWLHKNGKGMNRLYYTLRYFFTHTYYSIKIGLNHPALLRKYFYQQIWFLALLVALFFMKPIITLLYVYIPMMVVWLLFITITYDDHFGLHSKNPLAASFSKTNPFINTIILNNGYHMAHHLVPGRHWSKLPAYHATLEGDIPNVEAHTALNRFSLRLSH